MRGILIVNHFLNTEKYKDQTDLYLKAARKMDVQLCVCTNAQRCPESDFILFLDKDVALARELELCGRAVFNSAHAIALCDDKALTYLALRNTTLPMPKTLIAPMTFFQSDWMNNPFLDHVESELGFPLVLKEACGSFGWQVWMINDKIELALRLTECSPKRVILQEYISTSRGRDVRINIVGGEPVASMYRYSSTDFRANISSGGSMKPYVPTDDQVKVAVEACRVLGLDFGGVDLLFGDEDVPILCEVNSNAHIKNILDCTGINVAEHIIRYILAQMENRI
jgi:RimK family alpha-L-glutamate ligase